jgi:DUF1365 family protein
MSSQASSSPTQQQTESALYTGVVHHQRFVPKIHRFNYKIYLYWLKLSEIEQLDAEVKGFSNKLKGFSPVKFLRKDYLGDPAQKLESSVIARMSELNGSKLSGDVYFLGQVRTFGWYFSPVNFYYLRNSEGKYTHMLAEVSNTPWNKRHHYLVDLAKQEDCAKEFHVSPFNPMDMTYQWKIKQPNENLRLHLACIKQDKHFEAALNMQRQPLTTKTLRGALLSIPSMTLKTVAGIYWQAIKLFFKRVPIYMHP